MTCIVGIEQNGIVTMGGDSAGVAGYDLTIRSDEKVFRLASDSDVMCGYTSSFRMGQLLRYSLAMPRHYCDMNDMQYLVTDFVDAVRGLFSSKGYMKKEGEREEGGNFLLAYHGKLYNVECDFQIGISSKGYDAVGCGASYALGSLYATRDWNDPIARVKCALEAAVEFNAGVRPPFTIMQAGAKS